MSRKTPHFDPDLNAPEEFKDASRGERLHKYMASCGVASRRECEAIIQNGQVTINGQVVAKLPAWVDPANDLIRVDGRPLPRLKEAKRRNRATDYSYIMLNKPRHVITTTDDPEGRRHVSDLVDLPAPKKDAPVPRLFPVGRLDAESTGLILMTNDGELAHRLTHPKYEVSKQYEVSVKGRLEMEDLEKMKSGFVLAHRGTAGRRPQAKRAKVNEIQLSGYQRTHDGGVRTNMLVTLREGQNREIRRLFARIDARVHRLNRVSIGPLKLHGVAVGYWRKLTGQEVNQLCKKVGLV
jgi:23S rRNA pseudouridine2605 synthase